MEVINICANVGFYVTTLIKSSCCYILLLLSHNVYSASLEECIKFHVMHSEPIGYINDQGKPTGIHWEYLEALSEHSGLCINAQLMPYARIWKSIEYGNHDGGIIFKSESRDPLVQYAEHIQTTPTVVIALKGITLKKYSDLSNLHIGTMKGAHLSQRFDNDKSLNLLKLISFDQGTRMINLRRLDAVAGNAFLLAYQLQKFGVLDKVDLNNQLKLGEKEQWLQMSNKSQHLKHLPALKKSVEALKKSGVFRKIFVKYYGPHILEQK